MAIAPCIRLPTPPARTKVFFPRRKKGDPTFAFYSSFQFATKATATPHQSILKLGAETLLW